MIYDYLKYETVMEINNIDMLSYAIPDVTYCVKIKNSDIGKYSSLRKISHYLNSSITCSNYLIDDVDIRLNLTRIIAMRSNNSPFRKYV